MASLEPPASPVAPESRVAPESLKAPAKAEAPASPGVPARGASATALFADPLLNFQTLLLLGSSGYGTAEVGEVLAAVDRINKAGASYDVFVAEMIARGVGLRTEAVRAVRAGRPVTARSCFLRAANCFDQALFFVLGTCKPEREAALYARMQACWNRAARLFAPRFERVAIPYEGSHLPGYLLSPAGGGARPTIILNNGSDGQNVDLYAFGGAAAIERGYNALIFEGPGQGAMLFERQVPFRPDWEAVVTPVVDFLRRRSEVDAERIAIVGWSFGGLLVARAAAVETRLAAVVLDPPSTDYFQSWPPAIRRMADIPSRAAFEPAWAEMLAGATPQERFTIEKRIEIFAGRDAYAKLRAMRAYKATAALPRITAPTLVLTAQGEQFSPGQAQQAYELLRCEKKIVTFTAAEGANYHCEPMAPQTRNEVLFDWLDKIFRR